MNAPTRQRLPELDLLRTLAILGMVAFHAVYDLEMYYGSSLSVRSPGMWLLGRLTAVLFLLLVGASFAVSWNRRSAHADAWTHYLLRGFILIGWGMVVSAATLVIDQRTFVRFGILHCIGFSVIFLPALHRLGRWRIPLSVLLIAAGYWTAGIRADASILLPLGIMPTRFASVDYYPLLPWLGVVLIGDVIGDYWQRYRMAHPMRPLEHSVIGMLGYPGRHSLTIYLLHQPMLLAIFSLLWGIPKF